MPKDETMILYKYLAVKNADDWLIGENSILLTPPKYLNDLLEFRVRRESADSDDFIERVKGWLQPGQAHIQKVLINSNSHELELSDV